MPTVSIPRTPDGPLLVSAVTSESPYLQLLAPPVFKIWFLFRSQPQVSSGPRLLVECPVEGDAGQYLDFFDSLDTLGVPMLFNQLETSVAAFWMEVKYSDDVYINVGIKYG